MSQQQTEKHRARVLIVDDQPANINMLGAALQQDYELSVATNGEDALRIAHSEPQPDCILLDIVMPGKDGMQVCKELKEDQQTHDIPVIFITAMSEEEDETKGLELGAVDYITKPFRVPIVQARVRAVLALKQEMDKRMQLTRRLRQANIELEEANRHIMSSIEYAQGIQRAFLPDSECLDSYLKDYFIIWDPKDIIGGDIYWFHGTEQRFFMAIMDCTGHGVPGAIMTMIAGTSLDRVVKDFQLTTPADVLQKLNRMVKGALARRQTSRLADDGLDLGLCRFDRETHELVFSGARIAVYVVRENSVQEIRGDRCSIGYRSSDPDFVFSEHRLLLLPDDKIYLTTDGYLDQPGGEKRFSFGRSRFMEFLAAHNTLPFEEQKRLLQETFSEYRKEEPQVDDVTVIGFQIARGASS